MNCSIFRMLRLRTRHSRLNAQLLFSETEIEQSLCPLLTAPLFNKMEIGQSVCPWLATPLFNEMEMGQSVCPWLTTPLFYEMEMGQSVCPWLTTPLFNKTEMGQSMCPLLTTPTTMFLSSPRDHRRRRYLLIVACLCIKHLSGRRSSSPLAPIPSECFTCISVLFLFPDKFQRGWGELMAPDSVLQRDSAD